MFDSADNDSQESALVATFPDRETAHQAVQQLHHEGFRDTWIGLTRSNSDGGFAGSAASSEPRVEEDNALARFFGGGDESLHSALLRHGVSETDASRVDTTLPTNSAILTVHGANHPELAAQIVSQCGGTMVTSAASSRLNDTYSDRMGSAGMGSAGAAATGLGAAGLGMADMGSAGITATGSAGTQPSYASLGNYGAGKELGEEQRLQLREERLSVDKKRVDVGEAVVGKRVVSEQTEVDVPLVREELFIERRPASGEYAGAMGTIGDGQTIRVPLSREEVDVQKRTVVKEDVAVGQRRVEETAHVSETLRKEELEVDGDVEKGTGRTTRDPGSSGRL